MKRLSTAGLALAAGLALVVVGTLSLPASAFAAGSGYTPGGGPTPGGSATGLPGTVVSSITIQPSGGTATGTIGSATVTATVSAGTFPDPIQVVITDATGSSVAPSAGGTAVVTFGIGIYENGTKVTGTFPAVTVTISSPSITAGSSVYLVTGSGLQSVSGASVKAGSVTFTITSDPTFEVVSSTSAGAGTAIAGATAGQTGEPFLFEGGLAVALVLLGTSMLVGLRLRRRSA